jgi:hypothetical protein
MRARDLEKKKSFQEFGPRRLDVGQMLTPAERKIVRNRVEMTDSVNLSQPNLAFSRKSFPEKDD